MPKAATFDLAAAHKYLAADCHNKVWNLMDKPTRTAAEDEEMLLLSMASAWHWAQRPDCTAENKSIGYWQISRVYVLLGQADNARRYGQLALDAGKSEGVPSWCAAYGYEALARAEMLAGNHQKMAEYLAAGRRMAEAESDRETKEMHLADFETIT